ncbi:MAG: extracellular solute-binding protein [Oceanipulchritudo sp.]
MKKTLVYWDSNPNPGRTEAFTLAGERFAKSEGLAFRYVPVGIENYVQQVRQAWEGGSGPDIIDVWPAWVPQLNHSGGLLALDDWIADWPAALHRS